MSLRDFLYKVANGGMKKPINQLSSDHLDVLLSIWQINRRLPGQSQGETEVAKAFGGEGKHKFDEPCVQDLFKWKILEWVKEEKSFRINPALDGSLDEIVAAWRKLNPNQED